MPDDNRPMSGRASKLIRDLSHVPNIVGGLGLSIAAAQKAFNLDYLDNIERLLAMAMILLGEKKAGADGKLEDLSQSEKARLAEFRALFHDLLKATAPSRYQYTETTLAVSLDLAQTLDLSGSVGLGVGYGGLSLNAAFAMGYGQDYRAAAECKTVIHAIPADDTVFKPLLDRAGTLNDRVLALPPRTEVDDDIIQAQRQVFEKIIGAKAPDVRPEKK